MRSDIVKLVIVMFFAFGCFSPFQFYFTDYFGEEVYEYVSLKYTKYNFNLFNSGDAEAATYDTSYEDYQEGVRMGSLGFCFMQTIAFIYSLILPTLLKYIGIKVWLSDIILFQQINNLYNSHYLVLECL